MDKRNISKQGVAVAAAGAPAPGDASHVRYWIVILTFGMFFLMYMDRVSMGVVTPLVMREFGINRITMGWSASAFTWGYALFQIPGGWMADRFGPRRVLAGVLVWWAAFAALTGMAGSALALALTRFLFGLGEAAAFPTGSRAVVRWLPASQRAFGQGFQHAGSRFGAAVAPGLIVTIVALANWRTPFFMFGVVGLIWAAAWYLYYRDYPQEHPHVNAGELELLAGVSARRGARPPIPWRRILHNRNVWFLCAIYFCYGWGLWMYLNWFPTYLVEARHFTQARVGWAASLPLIAATITNLIGGWLSDFCTRRWGSLRRGRMTVSRVGFAIAGVALIPGVLHSNPWVALGCLTVALGGLELTVAVSWAMSIDLGQEFSGSVSGLMNTAGAVGGALSSVAFGYLSSLLGFSWPFIIASALCGVAIIVGTQIDPESHVTAQA
jgi:sugar phosphate permease